MSTIENAVVKPDLKWAQKYADEAKAKAQPANRGGIEANMTALGECETAQTQKDLLLAMLGDMSGQRPLGNRVLLATYVTRQKSKGGILFVDKRKDSSRYEGKVGLVIAVGPGAFKYDGAYPWEGPKPQVGDWVWYRASDAPERWIKDVSCRTIEDDRIEGITDDPMAIF
jgi:co-chaperonin GroES (HSP10)